MANIVVPEYQAMLDQILQSYGKKKEEADARGIGEAQRRGFVNQRGTSDIEGMLRSSAVRPLAEAESGAITDVYGRAAQQGAAERMQTQQNEYGKMMQEYMNQFNAAEAEKQRGFDERMLNLQRQWAASDAKKNRKGWWKGALGGLAGTAGGTAAGIGLAALSDVRLKENIKEIGTIKLYEFDYKDGFGLPKGRRVGVMAQDLEKILPEAVTEKDGYKMVDYGVFMRGR